MNGALRVALVCCALVVSAFALANGGTTTPNSGEAPVLTSSRTASPRTAASPPLVYTKLALTGGRSGEEGVWEMGADGSDPRQLFLFSDPGAAALSPTGTEVAIASVGSDLVDVSTLSGLIVDSFHVPDPSGTGIVSLSWSAGGNDLAYSVVGPSGDLIAFTVSTGGSDPVELGTPGGNPSWSPSGSALVVDDVGWYSGSTNGGLYIVTPGHPGARTIVSEPGSPGAPARPDWSPTGAQIAFTGLSGLEVVAAAGGAVTRLGVQGVAPVWSPDSTQLVYADTLNDATVSIFTVRADGSGDRDIDPSNGGYEDSPVGFIPVTDSSGRSCSGRLPGGVVAMAATASGNGYVIADRHGDVVACGDARFMGSLSGAQLNASVVDVVTDPKTGGYWLVASDGGVFAFSSPFFGSPASLRLRHPAVSLVSSADGAGYWIVTSDGGVFAYGAARFDGSAASIALRSPVVGASASTSAMGYRLVSADGGVFSFGAPFDGSTGGHVLAAPMVGLSASAAGGYRLVAADGGVFAFATSFHGSAAGVGLRQPIVGATTDTATGGYWLVSADGGVFAFDAPFCGSAAIP